MEALDWLRYSRQSFRIIMDMLAERSARLQRPAAPRAPSRIAAPPPPEVDDWPAPPPRHRPRPPPDAADEPEEPWQPPRRPRQGGEAAAGPNRTRPVQANVWRERKGTHRDADGDTDWDADWDAPRGPRCRRAGLAVSGAGWYVVRAGDTLWSIAARHYGDGEAYRRILRANWQRIGDADHLQPCQRLYIPRWGSPRPPDEDDWRDRRGPCPADRPPPGRAWPPSCHVSRGGDA
jgi:nucleoid-associated protein YgaU